MNYLKRNGKWFDSEGNEIESPSNKLDFSKPIKIRLSNANSIRNNAVVSSGNINGVSVQLDPRDQTSNKAIAADRLAQKYTEITGDTNVDASSLVTEDYFDGANQDANSYKRITPPSEQERKNYSKEDKDYLNNKFGYNFDQDEPEQETKKVLKKDPLTGQQIETIEGKGAVKLDDYDQFIDKCMEKPLHVLQDELKTAEVKAEAA